MPLIYPVGFFGGAKDPLSTAAPVTHKVDQSSFSANLGAGGLDLYVCVVTLSHLYSGSPPTGVTVGGMSLTQLAEYTKTGTPTEKVVFRGGIVSAGGTQTVSIAGTYLGSAHHVNVVRGSTTPTVRDTNGGASISSAAVNVVKGDVVLAGDVAFNTWITSSNVTLGPTDTISAIVNGYAETAWANISENNAAFTVSANGTLPVFGVLALKP